MKAILFENWNFKRILRLAMGIFIISQGVLAQESLLMVMGSLFSILAVLNVGCCGTTACNTPISKKNKFITPKEITYKEIK